MSILIFFLEVSGVLGGKQFSKMYLNTTPYHFGIERDVRYSLAPLWKAISQPSVEVRFATSGFLGKNERKAEVSLDGTWIVDSFIFDGAELSEVKMSGWAIHAKYTIKDKKAHVEFNKGDPIDVEFRIDSTVNPNSIDLLREGKTVLKGIFTTDSTILTMCLNITPDGDRPTKFNSKAGKGFVVVIARKK